MIIMRVIILSVLVLREEFFSVGRHGAILPEDFPPDEYAGAGRCNVAGARLIEKAVEDPELGTTSFAANANLEHELLHEDDRPLISTFEHSEDWVGEGDRALGDTLEQKDEAGLWNSVRPKASRVNVIIYYCIIFIGLGLLLRSAYVQPKPLFTDADILECVEVMEDVEMQASVDQLPPTPPPREYSSENQPASTPSHNVITVDVDQVSIDDPIVKLLTPESQPSSATSINTKLNDTDKVSLGTLEAWDNNWTPRRADNFLDNLPFKKIVRGRLHDEILIQTIRRRFAVAALVAGQKNWHHWLSDECNGEIIGNSNDKNIRAKRGFRNIFSIKKNKKGSKNEGCFVGCFNFFKRK